MSENASARVPFLLEAPAGVLFFVFVVDIFIVVVVVVFGVGVVVDSSENAGARVPLLLQAPAGANELQKPTEASISNISTTALEQ